MLIDGRSVAPGAEFTCAVCIVGAGPAGIAIADRLRGSGLSICLVESGGFDPELRTQRLYSGENVGHPYFRLDWCRFRLFGGSTNRWGGWCRPLGPFDYEKRDWVPHSGWPICESSVRPYYPDAARLLELPNAEFDVSWWNSRMSEAFPLEGTNFENALYQFSPQTNFGEVHGKKLFDAPNITTFVHANVTELLLDDGTNRIGTVVATAIGREPFSIKPRMVVLASGGIENPRLLLASRHDRPAGLGNEHDLVGRFFMEHLHVPAGHLVSNGVDSQDSMPGPTCPQARSAASLRPARARKPSTACSRARFP
jgi:choline dehydrogenase-like flavoprotein